MYSRRTGILQTSSEGLRKIESFNKNLREQYNNTKSKSLGIMEKDTKAIRTKSNHIFDGIDNLLKNEEVILIAMILLLFFDVKKDYLIIGVLITLLLLN